MYNTLVLDDITDIWFCAVISLRLMHELLILLCTAVSKAALVFIIHLATTFQIQFV